MITRLFRAGSILAVFLAFAGAVRGYDILLNTDFKEDTTHWKDDPNATRCLTAKPSPDGNGIVIPLDPNKWIAIQQNFDTPDEKLILNVTYTPSDDCSFDAAKFQLPQGRGSTSISTPTGQVTIPPLGRGGNFNPTVVEVLTGVDVNDFTETLKPNEWVALIADPQARTIHYLKISSSAPNPKAISQLFEKLMEHEEKTLYLAFPPGTGTVTITHASLDRQAADSSDNSGMKSE
jgi:hypothetical protein